LDALLLVAIMKKIFKKTKELLTKFKQTIKSIGIKRAVVLVIAFLLVFVVVASLFKKQTMNNYYETETLSYLSDDLLKNNYSSYLIDKKDANVEAIMTTNNMEGSIKEDGDVLKYINEFNLENEDKIMGVAEFLKKDDYITLPQVNKTGMYYLKVVYYDINKQINDNQFSILINEEYPFVEARTLKLPSSFIFESDEFKLDRYKNEIQPSSFKENKWQEAVVKDYDGLNPGYFGFYLKEGENLKITYNAGAFLIASVSYILKEEIKTYQQYLAEVPNNKVKGYYEVSARDLLRRSDASIHLSAHRDPSALYYHTQYLRLNTISGNSWLNGGETITYNIMVAEEGLYNLAFKYQQNNIKDMNVYRKIYLNGEVPYKELESYAFPYTTDFVNRKLHKDGDLYLYLKEGINEITLEVVNYPYRHLIETLKNIMQEIQKFSLAVKKYTSGGTDKYRDWDIEEYFPEAKDNLLLWADLLLEEYELLLSVSTNKEPTEIANLKVAAKRLKTISKNINKLPSKMVQFSDGDSSVSQMLGDLMQRMMRGGLDLEKIIVSNDVKLAKPHANIFKNGWEGLKRLILSYFNNPYEIEKRKKQELIVWVNHPRQYIEIMQMLIDANYQSELKITLSQMPDENKLILANTAGQAPDLAIGVNHWIPYEFAIRDASLDLRQFEGFEEINNKMLKGAFIPFVFENGVYGLPETQNFWVTYYRKDILQSIGINTIPNTWDEIIEILPILQSYGMNYFLPLAQYEGLKPFVATLPFIYQFGGNLYSENGMETAINSEETIKGIKMMSDLFTLYNMPQRVGSFYNEFRYGILPLGVSDLSMYLLLSNAAVELDGLWGMDLHPGNNIDGEILRYSPVGGQASMILANTKYPTEAWNFLKWWMDTDTQVDFQFRLETTYGKQYFWNSANIEAFMASSIPSEFKEVINSQWQYGIEAARIPGTYMVERSISNAWSEIVYNGSNARLAMDEAVRVSDREIKYKMSEFGYVVNNIIVKDYLVPSIYNIEEWLTEVGHD